MTKKQIPVELIVKELPESDLDGMIRMGMDIELKVQKCLEPMLVEILSYFRCEQCGECCRRAPAVVSDEELIAIARKTGNEAFDALDEDMLMNTFKAPCRFLSDHGCRIYDTRPMVCRVYPLSLKNMGFVTLIPCPLGKKIQEELENFIKSHGITKVRYEHDKDMQNVEDNSNNLREMAGFKIGEGSFIQIGLKYGYVPLFLKYLRRTKG